LYTVVTEMKVLLSWSRRFSQLYVDVKMYGVLQTTWWQLFYYIAFWFNSREWRNIVTHIRNWRRICFSHYLTGTLFQKQSNESNAGKGTRHFNTLEIADFSTTGSAGLKRRNNGRNYYLTLYVHASIVVVILRSYLATTILM
jgi:hypothetical protein